MKSTVSPIAHLPAPHKTPQFSDHLMSLLLHLHRSGMMPTAGAGVPNADRTVMDLMHGNELTSRQPVYGVPSNPNPLQF